ncbi:MAG: Citrate synthase [Cyanobacteria bacterium RYN_339]|nr:Citrate synthase [Cyanobacteria bacterium RYN_339]
MQTLGAKEAAEALGVSLATLYAYVSRGLIRSEAGAARERRYAAADVEALLARKEQRREPGQVARRALNWGAPVMESGITLILDGQLYYRGHDAVTLARQSTFEAVAELLWGQPFATPTPPPDLTAEGAPIERFTVMLPRAALLDPAALALSPAAVAQAGTRILLLMAGASAGSVTEALAAHWRLKGAPKRHALEAALILAADHELNVSAFTARCVASAGASPYGVVIAGLAALQGGRHGGHCERVEALFAEAGTPERAASVVAGRLRRGEGIPGFGQPLYPDGDPRGRELLTLAATLKPDPLAEALRVAARDVIREYPTIDFGLVTLTRALGLPSGSALGLFALGRTAGWIAHALEQYALGEMIRPRAHYTGPAPN